jgi:hypothetical protein
MAKTHVLRVSKLWKKSDTAVRDVYRKADHLVVVRESKKKLAR